MALKTYKGKAIIEVDYLTHAGSERAEEAFRKWLRTATQWSIGVNILVEPNFQEEEKTSDDVKS